MAGQINVISFLDSRDLVEELVGKLRQGGKEIILTTIDRNKKLTPDIINPNVSLNVLVVRGEEMSALKDVEWNGIPKSKTIRKDKSLSVAFCIDCTNIPSSLADYFLVKETCVSAEDIRREIVQIHSQAFQSSKGRYGYFVGRNSEIEQFQSLLYSERASRINALVVSGRPGVGREAYVRECIRQEKGVENYEPYILSMGKNGNVELFLVQLNSIHHLFSEVEIINILNCETEEKVKAAVKLLNELFDDDNYLLLYDDGAACIRYNRGLSDWFKSVITHPMLKGGLHLYVISNISVSYSRIKTDDDVAFITLYGLTLSDRKKLIYKRAFELAISLTEEQVAFLADKLVYSPSQLMKAVEDVKTKEYKNVKQNIASYQIVGDKKIMSLVKSYTTPDHPEARNILVLLSRIEYVNNKILYSVFDGMQQEVDAEIDRFMSDGIVERFGEWMDFIRLDSSISDYIRRNKIDYTEKSFSGFVVDKLDEIIENSPRITDDYAAYLYKLKKGIQRGSIDKESYLVPSVLVNTIAESYDEKNWPLTIKLCEKVLETHTNYFDDVYKEINYWYCLALARTQKGDKFYQTVQAFSGADFYFLKGFYLRIGKQYSKAEDEYNKALKINPSFARVKREMVIVLQAQHKFREALELAELNYEKDPENSYHIHAYFRCLVRKPGITTEERQLLRLLKEDKNNLFKSKFYIEGMDFEYKRFVDRAKPDVLLPQANELVNKYKGVAYIQDITDDYYVSQGLKSHLVPMDFSDDFNF